jgi:hypothetical protein
MNEHHPTTTPSARPVAAVPSRRKLLRGALSVPAVLTVYSGSSLASASHLRCLANANLAPQQDVPWSSDPRAGNFVRVALHTRTRGNGENNVDYWLFGGNLPDSQGRAVALPTPTQWQQFDLGTNRLTGSVLSSAPSPGTVQVSTSHFAAVRYDKDGFIVGVGAGPGGSAIGVSCWNSFLPGAAR